MATSVAAPNPYKRMMGAFKSTNFYGRRNLLCTILNGITEPEPRSYTIFGPRKIGKTYLLRFLREGIWRGESAADGAEEGTLATGEQELIDAIRPDYKPGSYLPTMPGRRRVLFVYIPFRFEQQQQVMPLLLRHLVLAVKEKSKLTELHLEQPDSQDQLEDSRRKVMHNLDELILAKWRVVFLLDDLAEALDNTISSDEENALRTLVSRASFVVTLDHLYQSSLNSPFLNSFWTSTLGLMAEPDAMKLIQEPISDSSLAPIAPISDDEAQRLIRLAGQQPYLLTAVCAAYLEFREEIGKSDASAVSDVLAIEQYKNRLLMRLLTTHSIQRLLKIAWDESAGQDERKALNALALAVHDPTGNPAGNPTGNPTGGARETKGSSKDVGSYTSLVDLFNGDEWKVAQTLTMLREQSLVLAHGGEQHIFSELFAWYVPGQYQDWLTHQQVGVAQIRAYITGNLGPIDERVFAELVSRQGKLCTFEDMIQVVWGDPNVKAHRRALDASINRLRRAIDQLDGSDRDYILNERGQGYKLALD